MIRKDETALICDLAETYHIYDYKRLPLTTVAAFSIGLRDDSRIKMKLSGARAPANIVLAAAIVDRLSLLVWMKTKDAEKNRNRPKSILQELYKPESETASYTSGEEFEKARQDIINQFERR